MRVWVNIAIKENLSKFCGELDVKKYLKLWDTKNSLPKMKAKCSN